VRLHITDTNLAKSDSISSVAAKEQNGQSNGRPSPKPQSKSSPVSSKSLMNGEANSKSTASLTSSAVTNGLASVNTTRRLSLHVFFLTFLELGLYSF